MNKSLALLTFIYTLGGLYSLGKAAGTLDDLGEFETPASSVSSSAASSGLLEPERSPSAFLEPQLIDPDENSRKCLKIMLKNRREIYKVIKDFGPDVLFDNNNLHHRLIIDLFDKKGEPNEKLKAILEVFNHQNKLTAFVELAKIGGYPIQFYSAYVSFMKVLDVIGQYDQAIQGWLGGKELPSVQIIKRNKYSDLIEDEFNEESSSVIIHQSDSESTVDESDNSSTSAIDSVNDDELTEDDESEVTEDEYSDPVPGSGCAIS